MRQSSPSCLQKVPLLVQIAASVAFLAFSFLPVFASLGLVPWVLFFLAIRISTSLLLLCRLLLILLGWSSERHRKIGWELERWRCRRRCSLSIVAIVKSSKDGRDVGLAVGTGHSALLLGLLEVRLLEVEQRLLRLLLDWRGSGLRLELL